VNENGDTPLHYAALNWHLSMVKQLVIEYNCDPTTHNSEGLMPLHHAAQQGFVEVVAYFVEDLKVIHCLLLMMAALLSQLLLDIFQSCCLK